MNTSNATSTQALLDRGVNCCIAEANIHVILNMNSKKLMSKTLTYTKGVDLFIVTACDIVNTTIYEGIIIINQYTYSGKGTSIRSSGRIEFYKNILDDCFELIYEK